MQVIFDLRPPFLVQHQAQRVDIARVLSVVLFLVFIIFSFYNIGYTAINYLDVRRDLTDATGEQMSVRDQLAGLADSIQQARNIKDSVVVYLNFSREELPVVEFMKALEDTVPPGLKIANLDVRPGNVVLSGSAASDNEINTFIANLDTDAMKYIITTVGSPTTTKSVLGSKQIADFRVSCAIRAILDIAANDPSLNQITTVSPEGVSGQ
ncbi:MAG: PilN domain-containing protein [Synergistaceae bacterium]|jgi:hypothetical protein|nr:PilN domain-containing protein [Synergistaceae bacterium]